MNRKTVFFLLIIILLHAIWFAAGMVWKHFYNGDSYEYIYLAESIKHGHYYGANPLLPLNDFRMSLRTPVYSLMLLACYSLFGYHNWVILLLQNILSIGSCWLILDTFQKIPAQKKFNGLYLLFLALYPAQMFFATTLAPDTLLQFFLMLYCRQLVLSLLSAEGKRIGYMSLWLLLATLTKPVVYPFLLLHLLYALWYMLYRLRSGKLLIYGLLPLLAMTAYGFWNKQRTGLYHISSIQSTNMLHYNVRQFLAWKHGPAYSDSVMKVKKEEQEALPDLKHKYEYASQEATRIIKSNFLSYSVFHLKESVRFFIEPGKSELDLYTGYLGYNFDPKAPNFYKSYREKGIRGALDYLKSYPWLPLIIIVFLFNLLRIAGGLLFLFNRKISLPLRLFLTLYILYFAVITGPVANTRYFLPVLPVLSAAAAIGLTGVPLKRNARQRASSL